MSEQPERAKRDDVIVFTASARGFPGDVIEQLKAKYGLEVRIRSSAGAIDGLISRAVDVVAYDRTYPGYGRNYDRDPSSGRFSFASRINPADRLAERIRELETPEELG